MRAVVLPLLATLLGVLLPGCLGCQPLLEVRHCLEAQCEASPDAVEVAWGAADAEAWPDVDRLLRAAEAGEHEHMEWTGAQEDAFWAHYGVGGEERELIVHRDGERFRVRVLACD